MQERMQYFHTLQKFVSPVSTLKHWSRPKSQTSSENMSSRRTLTWQSYLYKNPFMVLQVGNVRGDVVVSDDMKIYPTSFSIKKL
jgi:hypothetical protein